jgi:hypothetical protein
LPCQFGTSFVQVAVTTPRRSAEIRFVGRSTAPGRRERTGSGALYSEGVDVGAPILEDEGRNSRSPHGRGQVPCGLVWEPHREEVPSYRTSRPSRPPFSFPTSHRKPVTHRAEPSCRAVQAVSESSRTRPPASFGSSVPSGCNCIAKRWSSEVESHRFLRSLLLCWSDTASTVRPGRAPLRNSVAAVTPGAGKG